MNRTFANLLIVIAFLLLAWAYRLKRRPATIKQFPRRRSGLGRWAVIAAGLSIVFISTRYGLVGV